MTTTMEKLFISEGLPDRPYQTLDSHTVYKSEMATAEMKEVRTTSRPEFHPITTEIHVTELRPIKLNPVSSLKRGASESSVQSSQQSWQKRLASESASAEMRPQRIEQGYNSEFKESRKTHSSSSTRTTENMNVNSVQGGQSASNMIRTVTSRTGSDSSNSSPSATLQTRSTSTFRRRDVSPESPLERSAPIEGKCSCCPYGYHVDLDFLNYCDSLSSGSYLKQLKRIQREKRKLRKSMEVYLNQDPVERTETVTSELRQQSPVQTEYQESTTNKLLNEIDTSVDATLNSIDYMMKTSKQTQARHYTENDGTATAQLATKKFNTFPKKVGRQVAKDLQNYTETFSATLNTTDRTDSTGSLSSISTTASERIYPYQTHTQSSEMTSRMTHITSQQLAETMATHLPVEDGAASPQSNTINISKSSLQAIREAMAVSLQRMKDLEEQVKAIPVLQVRISVLKEEKRLLSLQMQAQEKKMNLKSVGVGDGSISESPITPISSGSLSPAFDFKVKSPPPVAPKPKKTRSVAIGDHSVIEPYLLQPDLPSSYTIDDNSTHVYEKETIIIDRAQKSALFAPPSPKPLTRSVGVGEGNVLDDSLHIHEKELRTVIIGQELSKGKRNVGIECRPQSRDVGVSYNCDTEKPYMRTVGIMTDPHEVWANVSFKSEEFTSALRNALHKSVRTVAVQVDSRKQYAHVGVQYATSSWNTRTIAVGDCSIDVEVRNPVARRSVSVDAQPDRMNRSINTDYGWRLDAGTNTVAQFVETAFTQTEEKRYYTTSSMTDRQILYNQAAQTDKRVFLSTDQMRTMGCNTERVLTHEAGMNTILKPTANRGINTIQHRNVRHMSMNTMPADTRNVGTSDDTIDSFVCDLEDKNSEDDYYRFEEEGVETKTTYYETAAGQKDTQTEKGYEIKRQMVEDLSQSQTSSKTEEEEEEVIDQNEEVVEEKVWRTTGDGQFTVTTVTTKRTFGADGVGDVVRESKTVTGGPEILPSGAKITVQHGDTQSVMSIEELQQLSAKEGRNISRGSELQNGNTIYTYSSSSSSGSPESGGSLSRQGDMRSVASLLGSELEDLRGFSSDSGMSSSQMSSSSEQGTTYSVQQRDISPLHSVRMSSPERQGYSSSYESSSSRGGGGTSGGLMSESSGSVTISQGGLSSTTRFEDDSPTGTLRSIMKKSSSDSGSLKKGISFAETVIGGNSSSENSDGEEEDEEEDVSHGTTESDSDTSYEEGCYDSREGSIVYKCKDDEAIAQGRPGAQMYDQNIRATYELSVTMKEACQGLARYLEDSTTIQTKQLNACLETIQQEWFKVAASKLADPHQVEDYMSSFNEISRRVLEYVVNMQDANGNTAIHYAVSNCNFEIVNLLLDTGICDLDKQNKAGYTAVIMATLASVQTERQQEVAQRLFSMGDVNIRASKDGQTALMFAVRQGRGDIVKMLLDTGADTNIQDDEGSTALMCAAEHGHTDICKTLLNTPGIDATISDNDGSTALSIAMEAGYKDTGVLLYAHVNFGPGQSPALQKKVRKSSGTSPIPSPTIK